jgi:hypothetical protein
VGKASLIVRGLKKKEKKKKKTERWTAKKGSEQREYKISRPPQNPRDIICGIYV